MVNFQQGDQYQIPFLIKQGNDIIDDTRYDVAIKIGNIIKKSYGVTNPPVYFDSTSKHWMYKLSKEDSAIFTDNTPVQIGLKTKGQSAESDSTELIYSPVQYVNFYENLINKGEW